MAFGMAAIELMGLTKHYGPTVGIEALDLTVSGGEIVGFLGPNGAGKTTTLRCLAGLLTPTSGTVRVLGLDPIAEHDRVAGRIGYLPGELRLYPELTGDEHLDLLADLSGRPAVARAALCERFGLTAHDLRRPVGGYSRGMKQKIGLVQAFQHEPDVAILDEPTEGLDPLVQEEFFALVGESAEAGVAVFLSSHVLSEVERVCQRVAVVRGGHLVADDEVANLVGTRARRVRITFEAGVARGQVRPARRWKPSWSGSELSLVVPAGDVVSVLRRMLKLAVTDVVVEEAALDEAFLDLYRDRMPGAQVTP